MFNWLREYLELKYEFRERKLVCESCEILKQQLSIANIERDKLLNRLLEKPTPPPIPERNETPQVIRPHVPWAVQRQLKEQEDREKNKLMREAPKPKSTEDLEKELEDASETNSKS